MTNEEMEIKRPYAKPTFEKQEETFIQATSKANKSEMGKVRKLKPVKKLSRKEALKLIASNRLYKSSSEDLPGKWEKKWLQKHFLKAFERDNPTYCSLNNSGKMTYNEKALKKFMNELLGLALCELVGNIPTMKVK